MRTLSIETPTHGRVLVRDRPGAQIVLLGFHGYTENADVQMARLETVAGNALWTLVSVQGLHRFYRGKTPDISASWMTRQDREQMITDNIEYVDRVVAAVVTPPAKIVTLGFSQGVAMAFRAALRGRVRGAAIVAVGGDVPPELLGDRGIQFPPVLLARGETDDWYTASKLSDDVAALTSRGMPPSVSVYPGGHIWTDAIARRTHEFIVETFRGG
jgi:predicted esterase